MNLLYAEVIHVFAQDEMRFAKVRVGGALRNVPLDLLPDANRGDEVLLCDGVAIAKVGEFMSRRKNAPFINH